LKEENRSDNLTNLSLSRRFTIGAWYGFTICLWFIVPIIFTLILVRLEALSSHIASQAIIIIGFILMILGLPLSAALRIDQLSLELGAQYSREIILVIALLVASINICLIFALRGVIVRSKNSISAIDR